MLPAAVSRILLPAACLAVAAGSALAAGPATAAAPHAVAAGESAGAAGACRGANAVPTARTLGRARRAMRCLIARDRRRRGMGRLRPRRALRRAAIRHSRDMVRRSFFAHHSPGGSTLVDRVRRAGYLRGAHGYMVGENIAWGTGRLASPARIHRSLMRSPSHRANILRRRFRDVGVGIALGAPSRGRGRAVTWTIDFGRRAR